ncbi:MAG: teichoic acid biosynthesis protein [Desulfovibrio sp.]|nr:teichoic acid biosynthesis protein [Desulfovibrio sp.]
MARILYGIHGTGHGHAMRGLTIARALPGHEFLFVASDDAPSVLEPEFPVKRIPNLGTVFKNYKVALAATIKRALPLLIRRDKHIESVLRIIEDFKPDVCLTDLEYFTPRAAERAGISCLTLDHQHILTSCRHDPPPALLADALLQGLAPRYLFRPTEWNALISFYAPPVAPRYKKNTRVLPPILRDKVIAARPRDDGHILVYQSNSTDSRLIEFLASETGRKAYVFGYGDAKGKKGNIQFMPKSEDAFIDLLASCAYVIQGGSHTLMSEALFLGKPILSLPLEAMIEQRLNAFYLEKLGYGRQAKMADLDASFIQKFEDDAPEFRRNIGAGQFLGNDQVFGLVDQYAKTGKPPIPS